jgi:hypothetical protein
MRAMSKKSKKDIEWFGMKLTPQEKAKIKTLADKKGVSQKEAVMGLVNEEMVAYQVTAKPGSILEKMQQYVGVIEGPGDLSTNPKHMEGYGKNRIS